MVGVMLVGTDRLLNWVQHSKRILWVNPLIRQLLRKHRNYLTDNLKRTIPDQSDAFYQQVSDDIYRNMLTTSIESLLLSSTTFQKTRCINLETTQNLAKHSPIMFVSCHINNWEICCTNLLKQSFPIVAFYRDFSHCLFDHRRYNQINRFGPSIPTHQVQRYVSAIDHGHHGFMMMDIKVKKGRNGKKLRFCGHPAWT